MGDMGKLSSHGCVLVAENQYRKCDDHVGHQGCEILTFPLMALENMSMLIAFKMSLCSRIISAQEQ